MPCRLSTLLHGNFVSKPQSHVIIALSSSSAYTVQAWTPLFPHLDAGSGFLKFENQMIHSPRALHHFFVILSFHQKIWFDLFWTTNEKTPRGTTSTTAPHVNISEKILKRSIQKHVQNRQIIRKKPSNTIDVRNHVTNPRETTII